MTLDLDVLAEKAAAIDRHLWQATQVAMSAAVRARLGSPSTYADALRNLAAAGLIDAGLADRLARAAGLMNVIVRAYADLDLRRVHEAASKGPDDLGALLGALRDA